MAECRKVGLWLAAAMEKLRVTVPAADTGRPYITPWEENRGTDKAYTYMGTGACGGGFTRARCRV